MPEEAIKLIPQAQEHTLLQEDGKKRFVQLVTDLSREFALCTGSYEAKRHLDDVAFFQAVKASLNKNAGSQKSPEKLDAAIH